MNIPREGIDTFNRKRRSDQYRPPNNFDIMKYERTNLGQAHFDINTSWADARVKLHSQVHFGYWIKICYQKSLTSFGEIT